MSDSKAAPVPAYNAAYPTEVEAQYPVAQQDTEAPFYPQPPPRHGQSATALAQQDQEILQQQPPQQQAKANYLRKLGGSKWGKRATQVSDALGTRANALGESELKPRLIHYRQSYADRVSPLPTELGADRQ